MSSTDSGSFAAGAVLAERYTVVRRLGFGGFAEVYHCKAGDGFPTDVAVKTLREAMPGPSSQAAGWLQREAVVLKGVPHECVVEYIAHGMLTDGRPYLVMEYVAGESLGHRIKRLPQFGELSNPELACLVLARISDALAALHRAKPEPLIHRDIKPDNIILRVRDDGEIVPVLVDFGLARPEVLATLPRVTEVGQFPQTVGYANAAASRGVILPQNDIFALGCVFFEVWAGRDLFAASPDATGPQADMQRLFAATSSARQALPEVPEDLIPRRTYAELAALFLRMVDEDEHQIPPANEVAILARGALQELRALRAARESAVWTAPIAGSQRFVVTAAVDASAQDAVASFLATRNRHARVTRVDDTLLLQFAGAGQSPAEAAATLQDLAQFANEMVAATGDNVSATIQASASGHDAETSPDVLYRIARSRARTTLGQIRDGTLPGGRRIDDAVAAALIAKDITVNRDAYGPTIDAPNTNRTPESPIFTRFLFLRRSPPKNTPVDLLAEQDGVYVPRALLQYNVVAFGEDDFYAVAAGRRLEDLQPRAPACAEARLRFAITTPALASLTATDGIWYRLPWRAVLFLRIGPHLTKTGYSAVVDAAARAIAAKCRHIRSLELRFHLDLGPDDLILELASAHRDEIGLAILAARRMMARELIDHVPAHVAAVPDRWQHLIENACQERPFGHVFASARAVVGIAHDLQTTDDDLDPGDWPVTFHAQTYPGHEHEVLQILQSANDEIDPSSIDFGFLAGKYELGMRVSATAARDVIHRTRELEREASQGAWAFSILQTKTDIPLLTGSALDSALAQPDVPPVDDAGQHPPHDQPPYAMPLEAGAMVSTTLLSLGLSPVIASQAERVVGAVARATRDAATQPLVADIAWFVRSLALDVRDVQCRTPADRTRVEAHLAKAFLTIGTSLSARLEPPFGSHFAPGAELESCAVKCLAALRFSIRLAAFALSERGASRHYPLLLTFGHRVSTEAELVLENHLVIHAVPDALSRPAEALAAIHELLHWQHPLFDTSDDRLISATCDLFTATFPTFVASHVAAAIADREPAADEDVRRLAYLRACSAVEECVRNRLGKRISTGPEARGTRARLQSLNREVLSIVGEECWPEIAGWLKNASVSPDEVEIRQAGVEAYLEEFLHVLVEWELACLVGTDLYERYVTSKFEEAQGRFQPDGFFQTLSTCAAVLHLRRAAAPILISGHPRIRRMAAMKAHTFDKLLQWLGDNRIGKPSDGKELRAYLTDLFDVDPMKKASAYARAWDDFLHTGHVN